MRSRHWAAISAAVPCAALAILRRWLMAGTAPSNATLERTGRVLQPRLGHRGPTLKGQLYSTISIGFNEGTRPYGCAADAELRRYALRRTRPFPRPRVMDTILWVYDRASHPYRGTLGATWTANTSGRGPSCGIVGRQLVHRPSSTCRRSPPGRFRRQQPPQQRSVPDSWPSASTPTPNGGSGIRAPPIAATSRG